MAAVVADGVAVVVGIVLTMEGKDKREDEEDYKGHAWPAQVVLCLASIKLFTFLFFANEWLPVPNLILNGKPLEKKLETN